MRIAVLGGTGVAGRHTVEALRRAGHDTIVRPDARLAATSFDTWLKGESAKARSV